MATYLDGILAHHRARAAADSRTRAELEARAARRGPRRDFLGALGGSSPRQRPAVIAEVKRRSPSKGPLAVGLDAAVLAKAYEAGGAAALSVLTDGPHFGGSSEDLVTARAATGLPVLRKDFTVADADVFDACAMGADAVLLIVAALSDDELKRFIALASELGLAALVEVHDEAELTRALAAGAVLVGVNQRDLHTFSVDRARAERVGAAVPAGIVKVAESGITSAGDVARLAQVGFDAVLIGEALVRAPDARAALEDLRPPRPAQAG